MSDRPLPAVIRPPAPAELSRELKLAESYAASALAASTRRAYERDWLTLASWCAERGLVAIPAEPATIAAFLAAEADREFRPVTIGRRAAAIAVALRRSELVALNVEDLRFDLARGLILTIRKSKTDQEQAGAQVAVPYARARDRCPVRALQAWLQQAEIHRGPEQEIRSFYDAVWNARRGQDVVMIKTLLYTGVRVSELVSIRIGDVDLDRCRIRIEQGKGKKDRYVPFPASFKETLALHIHAQKQAGASHLFESSWKKPYSDRGVRKILARYATAAGVQGPISPHRLRHFLSPG